MSAGELDAGLAALGRGRFAEARSCLEQALGDCPPDRLATLHERLAGACFALEDYEVGLLHGQEAFRRHREAGDARGAAFVAILLANINQNLGNTAAQRGWLARSRRLLDGEGPCVEAGYLAVATSACDVVDVVELERATSDALEIAREFGDVDLEVRALADAGLAMVRIGRVAEGLAQLDEAMAAIVAGDVSNHVFAAKSCCAMLHACDHIGDVERAAEWTRAVTDYARSRFGDPPPPILLSHCRIALGTLLVETGRWEEAEAELRQAAAISRAFQKRAEAAARLAELFVRQGRLAEAAGLVAEYEEAPVMAAAAAGLELARGDARLADGILRPALRWADADLPATLRLLAVAVQVAIQRGEPARARTLANRMREVATGLGTPGPRGLACLASARAAAAEGADPAPQLTAALDALGDRERPVLRADISLELATALSRSDPESAIGYAMAPLATYRRLGLSPDENRAVALLRSLGVATTRRAQSANRTANVLSPREEEVLALLGEGLTNSEIGKRLFITQRTAEHHVASILAKLGFKRRAEAAAHAVRSLPR